MSILNTPSLFNKLWNCISTKEEAGFGNNETFYVLQKPFGMSDDDIINYQFGDEFHLHNPVGAGMVVWSFNTISEYYCLDSLTITKEEFIRSKLKRRIEHINEI